MYVERVVMGEKMNGRFIRERNTDKNAEADGKRTNAACTCKDTSQLEQKYCPRLVQFDG